VSSALSSFLNLSMFHILGMIPNSPYWSMSLSKSLWDEARNVFAMVSIISGRHTPQSRSRGIESPVRHDKDVPDGGLHGRTVFKDHLEVGIDHNLCNPFGIDPRDVMPGDIIDPHSSDPLHDEHLSDCIPNVNLGMNISGSLSKFFLNLRQFLA